ncbi:MAG: hypothetical protein QG657_2147, partial [Acidobacteriota bacterium]|nr:hypothetical protein [Acidobacteriota bacterium]
MDFEYDVFISYTHLDNKPLSKDEEGWISRFHYSFDIRLAQLLGREPKIWRDNKLQGNDEFSDQIIARLNKTKILLVVISPCYLNSKWCKDELNLFLQAAVKSDLGSHIGNKSRVFKVIKTHVSHDRHPDELRGLLGYDFCELDEKQNIIEFSEEKGSKYWIRLNEVAGDIYKLIEEMDQPDKTRVQPPVNPPAKCIYLAETTSDLREVRENIRSDLILQGYTIFPDRPLPYLSKDGKFSSCVHEYLKRCKLSVHLIGNLYGLIPEEEKQSIVVLQNQLAAELCQDEQLTRLILVPPGIDKEIKSAPQKEYIDALRNEAPQVKRTELLETGLEEFKTHIQDTLAELSKPPKIKPPSPLRKWVYLLCDQQDLESVKLLDRCLFDQGFEVKLPLFQGSETERREMHKENLCLCDALLIYYDTANESWMFSKLNDLRKALGYGRTSPIKNCAIFIGGKETEHKEHLHTHEAEVIKNYGPFTCDVLSPFTAQL